MGLGFGGTAGKKWLPEALMRILIADDSKVAMLQLKKPLEAMGHQVVGHAKTGIEAVSMFLQLRPELVFLDLVMPELDGIGALQRIRAEDPNVPAVIVSSAVAVGAQLNEAAKLNAVSMISKPITQSALEKVLQKIPRQG
jgi:two-component system chemotaxis response regulator CheY